MNMIAFFYLPRSIGFISNKYRPLLNLLLNHLFCGTWMDDLEYVRGPQSYIKPICQAIDKKTHSFQNISNGAVLICSCRQ